MEIVISNPHLDINEILKIKSNEYIQGFFNENMLNSSLINNMFNKLEQNVFILISNENLKKLDDLYNVCKTVTQVERNIFIVWHLFALVQMLIHKFINFHGKINCYNKILKEYLSHYDNILLNIWHEKMKQNTRLLL
uniref:Protein kinase domain-containing protein n=1 Tax=Meloidogyne hapla TaxID=6305 RepID=A0A1I8B5W6_MELHA